MKTMDLELNYWLAERVMGFKKEWLYDLRRYHTYYFLNKHKSAVCWNPTEHTNDAMEIQKAVLRKTGSLLLSHNSNNDSYSCNAIGLYANAATLELAICLFAKAVWPRVQKTSQAPAALHPAPRRKAKRRKR